MGNKPSNTTSKVVIDNEESIVNLQTKLENKYKIAEEVKVAHYTPSIFPLIPLINHNTCQICKKSWKIICDKKEMSESGLELTGITLFYNDFYDHLLTMDENVKIEAVLSAHSTGKNKIVEKGAIIIRIINYILSIDKNDEQTQYRLYNLGKAHARRNIRPYMYSIFVQTMLYTIANQLELHASHEVMEAWVHMFAFVMKSMLPLAIKGQTIDTELFINTRTEFSSDNIKAQMEEIKDRPMSNRSNRSNRGRLNFSGFNSGRNSQHSNDRMSFIPSLNLVPDNPDNL